ncbi:MAG: alkaline phosphatase, partial [Candidatus Promineifilaceae bacterium]
MNRKFRLKKSRLAVRVSIFVLLFAVFGVVNASAIEDKQEIPKQLGDNGQEAIDRLGSRLPDVAADYGLTSVELEEYFRSDSTLFVDSSGELYYSDLPFTEDTAFLQADSLSQGTAPFDESETFTLHSLPGATHVIYLDFDGHTTVAGTTWNGGASFYSPPYDIDGDPSSFSASEIEIIQKTWQLVAEDYSPFMVDVTTEDPGPEALSDQGNGDVYYGTRVVVTDDTWSNCGCGGQAYVGSFDDRYDEPAFVYNQSLRGVAEAASHEVGHTVYLSHDGTSTASYYHGHGTGDTGWAPLMGASYYKPVTQWSMGDYYDCNNSGASANYGQGPDDLAVIASMTNGNAFGYRADDHGSARQAASALNLAGDTISGSGIIEQTDDVDVFSFNTGQGDVNITVSGAPPLSNLDIYAELRDESGAVITSADPADLLSVSLSASLDAGTYYLHIDGTGTGDPMNPTPTGYTQHASLGQYTISGTVANPEPFAKYVILMIGDGMGFEQVKAADYFNGGELSFETLPYTTSVSTYSADSSITDSAASATAMAAGQKVNNGVISIASPGDGSELQTVLEIFKAQGKNVGLVSTAFMSHATPAAFGAHEPSRDNYGDIANDYLTQTVPHVLFGGGANGMSSSAAATAGYTVVTDRVGMQALDTEATTFVSGQFGATHLHYEYDGDYSSLPHLDEMTETAINILDNNDVEGFFVMIEGGRIDHAEHENSIEDA